MLDTHQLNVFTIAANTLNFTKAAEILHLSQPSVSQHINSLEKRFGTPLFFRSGRHLELTDAGRALIPLARDLVNLSNTIEETMNSLQGEVYGHLKIGCSTTPGKYVIPLLLARFHELFPRVTVSCMVTSQYEAALLLDEGSVHFALSSTPGNLSKSIDQITFMTDPIRFIVPVNHLWADRDCIQPEELLTENFIMREDTSGTSRAIQSALKSVGVSITDLNTFMTLGNAEAIALAVQEGLGVGFVSSMVVNRLTLNGIKTVSVEGLTICRDIFLGSQTNRPATIAQLAFWDFVKEMKDYIIKRIGAECGAELTTIST